MKEKITEQELLKMSLEKEKGTVQTLLDVTPEKWKSAVIRGANECLRLGWPLHTGSIQMAARETSPEAKTSEEKANS